MKQLTCIVVFLLVFLLHLAWFSIPAKPDTGPWASFDLDQQPSPVAQYFRGERVWLGLSYATAAAFAAFCIWRLRLRRKGGLAAAVGGLGLTGFLYLAGCFLLGCCGSPMLAVYVGLLGPRFLGFTGPIVLGMTVLSVTIGYFIIARKKAAPCACATACCGDQPGDAAPHWITGRVRTPAGEVRRVDTTLRRADGWGAFKARTGINRTHYTVPPALYCVGNPTPESPVLVTANYKLSFDHLRRSLPGRDAWIMVLDTKGINVWCAAGKGTFGTDELVRRTAATGLGGIVSHGTLILPQLGAPGVAAHEVRKRSGFRVVYGPVRACELPPFLDAGMKATAEMRRVTFTLSERLALVPMELTLWPRWVLLFFLGVFLLAGLGPSGYSFDDTVALGGRAMLLCLLAFVGGTTITPALLPWLPGRAFALKGAVVGLLIALGYTAYRMVNAGGIAFWPQALPWLLMLPAVAAFFAMNFTGASNYTSLSGVRREMRFAVPAQIAAAALGLVIWVAVKFIHP